MKYKKFIISGYRGIAEKAEINIAKESLIPIIGKNEGGKTTCLEAIYAFDHYNDTEHNGRHLNNIENLYSTIEAPITVCAEIFLEPDFDYKILFEEYFEEIHQQYKEKYPEGLFDISNVELEYENFNRISSINAYRQLVAVAIAGENIVIERDLKSKSYSIPIFKEILDNIEQDVVAKNFIRELPYILYFDDFRDRFPEQVFISNDTANSLYDPWIKYIEELFLQTNAEYDLFALPNKQDSIRRSIITEAQKRLNEVLIREWSKYQFDNQEEIEVKIEYEQKSEGGFLRFKIVEKVLINGHSQERYFDISDRSKGFYWYFNFMLKLHFNPSKRDVDDMDTIYLLDEPGSYLHTYALDKLAEQLKRLSKMNKVIYCTHFHNLLNPDYVPINSIRIAEKTNRGGILLKRLDDKKLTIRNKNSAYQPILEALEVKPPLLEYSVDNIVMVEGIYDYYSFKMFTDDSISYFPCVSATSIIHQIQYMIFLNKNYLALWDNDGMGREMKQKAEELFGEIESERFIVLDSMKPGDTCMEDFYDLEELRVLKEKKFNNNQSISLYKVILALYYDEKRGFLLDTYFAKTKSKFAELEKLLLDKLSKLKKGV